MAASTYGDAGDAGASGPASALVLELVLAPGEPLSGTIGPAGQSSRMSFRGWIDLMSAINNLRVTAGITEEPPGSGRPLP